MQCLSFFVILSLLHTAFATGDPIPSGDQLCLLGCQIALSQSTFAGEPSIDAGYYVEELESIYACGRQYCSSSEISHGQAYLNAICETYALMPMLNYDIVANLTNDDIQNLPRVTYGDTALINTTTIPDPYYYDLGYRTGATWYGQRGLHLRYSQSLFIFWGACIFLATLINAASYLPASVAPVALQKLSAKIQAALVLAPALGYHCSTSLKQIGLIPPRLETSVILVYFAVNLALSAVSYETFTNNLYYAEPNLQLLRYIADRTGYLAYANLSIFWLFGIRNNFLIWMTGWPFPTFNSFHRWVARIATLEAVVHSVVYTVFSYLEGGYSEYAEEWTEQYWYTGVLSTVAMCLALGFSMLWVRQHFYDFFLMLHIGLALATLVGLFYHTSIFLGEYDGFLWPCVAFWVFDRCARLGRIIINFCEMREMETLVEYDAAADLMRIDISNVIGRFMKRHPGSYIFLYMPNQLRFWESHPFTLTRWVGEPGSEDPKLKSIGGKGAAVSDREIALEDAANDHYTLMLRPHRGFTLRLAHVALRCPSTQAKFLVEGPYGQRTHIAIDAATVMFIIGGSGISVAVAAIYDLLERPSPPAIRLVWAVRQQSLLHSVLGRELRHASARIQIEAFVTRSESTKAEAEIGSSPQPSIHSSNASIAAGRPDLQAIFDQTAEKNAGLLQVVACGPASMMDDTRSIVLPRMRRGSLVRLSMESFTW